MNESEKLRAALDLIREHEDEIIATMKSLGRAPISATQRLFDVCNAMSSLAESNATFIVTACNAHDDLVAALAGMLETHGMHGPCKMNNCSDCKYAAKKAEAAIAKALGMVPA